MTTVNIPMEDPGSYVKEFPRLEPGTYEMDIKNKLGLVTASSGNKMCEVQWTYTNEDGQEYVVFDRIVVSDGCHYRWYQFYRALGFSDDDIRAGDIQLEDLQGYTAQIRVGQELDQNKELRACVKRYLFEGDKEEEATS